MTQEIKNVAKMLQGGSYLDEDSHDVTIGAGDGIKKLLNRKVDKRDLVDFVNSKTNKTDTEMMLNQI